MSNSQVEHSDGYRWVMLVAYVLMSLGIWSCWFAQAPLLHVYWGPVFHINEAMGALLLSLPGLVAIILAVTTGRWVDTVGPKKMMRLSGVLACIGFGLRPFFATSFLANAILTVIAGYAVCILTATLPVVMIRWFGHEKGHTYIGIGAGSYFISSGIGILVTANLFPLIHARGVFTLWSIVILAVTVFWWVFAREKEAGAHERAAFGVEFKNVMQTGSSWLMVIYAIFISGTTVAAMQLLPGEMIVVRHLPPPLAGVVVGIFSIAMGVGMVILPSFAGRVGKKRLSILLCAATLIVFIIYMILPQWTVAGLFVFAIVYGFFFEAPWATGLALMESLPGVTPGNIGVAAGVWTMAVNIGVFFLPIVAGAVVDATGGPGGAGLLWSLLIGYAIGLAAVLPVREKLAPAKAKAYESV